MQLELPFWAENSLRAILRAYLDHQADRIADATVRDYADRAKWLLDELGESTRADLVTYDTLGALVRRCGPAGKGLMHVTLKKRLVFLRAAFKLAAKRRIISRDLIPDLPDLPNDSRRRNRHLSSAQLPEFCGHLSPRFARLARLAFGTGMHALDLWTTTLDHLDPHYVWRDGDGGELGRGRWWRRNHKNRRCVPTWIPMEPELRELALELRADPSLTPKSLVCGRIWGVARAFAAASDRMGIPRVALIDLRHSFATLLLGRDYSYEYVRIAMGHEGEIQADGGDRYAGTKRPSTLSRHYAHPSDDLLTRRMRNA